MTATPDDTSQPNAPAGIVVSDACSASPLYLRAKLDALSPRAKAWLEKTCERVAKNEGYEKSPQAVAECIAAGLIWKRKYYIKINRDVMGLVCSNSYFRQNKEASRDEGGAKS